MKKVNKFTQQGRPDDSLESNKTRAQRQRSTTRIGASSASADTDDKHLTSRYQRRGVSTGKLLAERLEADFDDALDGSETVEQELDESGEPEDSGHFLPREQTI